MGESYFWPVLLVGLILVFLAYVIVWMTRPQFGSYPQSPVKSTGDALDDEFAGYSGALLFDEDGNDLYDSMTRADISVTSNLTLPETFFFYPEDLLPIRDQGQCGLCWAFNILDTLGDRILLASRDIRTPLSIMQFAACGTAGTEPDRGINCARGGYPMEALRNLSDQGVIAEVEYPYDLPYDGVVVPETASGPVPDCVPKTSLYRAFAKEPKILRAGSTPLDDPIESTEQNQVVRAIKEEIYIRGPVVATMSLRATEPGSGLYDLAQYQYGTLFEPGTGEVLVRHMVAIVGWVDHPSTPYWIVRNSWDPTRWPRGPKPANGSVDPAPGFFRIPLGRNVAGIESRVIAFTPVVYKQGRQLAFRNAPAFINRQENQWVSDEAYRIFLYTGFAMTGAATAAAGLIYWGTKWEPSVAIKAVIVAKLLVLVVGIPLIAFFLSARPSTTVPATVDDGTVDTTLTAESTLAMDTTRVVALWQDHVVTREAVYQVDLTTGDKTIVYNAPTSTQILGASQDALDRVWVVQVVTVDTNTYVQAGLLDPSFVMWSNQAVTNPQFLETAQVYWQDTRLWISAAGKVWAQQTAGGAETVWWDEQAQLKVAQGYVWTLTDVLRRHALTSTEPDLTSDPWYTVADQDQLVIGPVLDADTIWLADQHNGKIYRITDANLDATFQFSDDSIGAIDEWTQGAVVGSLTGTVHYEIA